MIKSFAPALIIAALAASAATAGGTASSATEAPAMETAAKAAAPAMAASKTKTVDDRSGFGLNAGVSTLGATIEPVWRINNRFGFRAPIGNGSYSYEETSDGETYEGDLNIGGVGLLADFYPTGKNFRLTAGAFKTDYSADLMARNVDVSGYGNADISVSVSQKQDISPYLGLGYDGRIGKHGTISFGAGAIFGGGFDVDARESTGMAPQDLIDDEIGDISDTLGDLGVIPYVSLMVGFRF